MTRLLLATNNPGKIIEMRELLVDIEVELVTPGQLGLDLQVEESGHSYAENSALKARAYARKAKILTLADDSGLEVNALDGAPGVRSARYAKGHDGDRVTALLTQLFDVPWEQRTARFRCVVVIAMPTGELYSAKGVCEGQIAFEPTGRGGFGYDPVFYLPTHDCTMAQLPQEEKNRISHRERAIEAAMPILDRLLRSQTQIST